MTESLKLDTMVRVRRELVVIYKEAKAGHRNVADASRLANILSLIGRIIEGGELESRVEEVEQLLATRGGHPRLGP